MFFQLKNYNFYIIFCLDLLLFSLALLLAHFIRFEFSLPPLRQQQLLELLPLALIIKSTAFFAMKLYRGMFRYTGLKDLWRLSRAVGLSSLLLVTAVAIFYSFLGYSRSVFLIDAVLTLFLTGGLRLMIRFFFTELNLHREDESLLERFRTDPKQRVVLIYGAGSAGEKLYREIVENPRLKYRIVGFMDDDPKKLGRSIHGIPVWGDIGALRIVTEKLDVQEILIAIPSSTGAQMRTIVDACKACEVPFRTLPGLGNIIDCKVDVNTLRNVEYRDLLRREPVVLDHEGISAYLTEKIVLVTGAGGSIGSELCRQIIRFQPRQLILLDASEAALYHVQMELKHRAGYQRYATALAHIQDEALIDRIMQKYRPEVIFHAAAYKHVPMLERNPWQAVNNNIRGQQVMVEKALAYGVGRFVLVSTDKAVRPTNIMGASKRICELILQSHVGMASPTSLSCLSHAVSNSIEKKKAVPTSATVGTILCDCQRKRSWADVIPAAPKHESGEEDFHGKEPPNRSAPAKTAENRIQLPKNDVLPPEAHIKVSDTSVGKTTKQNGREKTRFMSVRFGNVVGSSGSVIPLFREQIERGGPVTVTHPEVTRYFMTIPEAAQLILQAGAQGEGGETFVLEMGEAVKIADLARDLIRLYGLEPDKDIEIRFTGLRQGEKLYEELITDGEGIVPTEHKKIMVLKANGGWNGYGDRDGFRRHLMEQLNRLYTVARSHDIQAIRKTMKEIVPEFQAQESQCIL